MGMLAGLLLLGWLTVSMATECGDPQKLKVKQLWTMAYKSGSARRDFVAVVGAVFLRKNPDYHSLFEKVGAEDPKSPSFRAHMMRVIGGIDAIISVFDDKELYNSVVGHYAQFHKKFGQLPYMEMGKALATVMPRETNCCFDEAVWNACFEQIAHDMYAPGLRQSPVDIVPEAVQFDAALWDYPWTMQYDPEKTLKMTNNGHTVKVSVDYTGSRLSGGPLQRKRFCLEQFHFHWGSKNNRGSEHTVEGYAFPAELHLVHFNCQRYTTFADAFESEDGLAVLGVFLQVGPESNPTMKKLTDKFLEIHYKDQTVSVGPLNPKDLLPSDITSYWTYLGSLTTPPYSETVTWIVFRDPIFITQTQLESFRHLMSNAEGEDHGDHHGDHDGDHHAGPLVDNYREVQPLNRRVIKATFY